MSDFDDKPRMVSVTLKRTMSDGNYGSTTIGIMMDEYVPAGGSRAEVANSLIEKEAAFIKAKFAELNKNTAQDGLE